MKQYKFIKNSDNTIVTNEVNKFLLRNKDIMSNVKFDWKADVGSYSYTFVCLEYEIDEVNISKII